MMGLLVLLTVLFVALKLIGVIDWSWWLVVAPMYLWFFFYALLFLMAIVGAFLQELERRKW